MAAAKLREVKGKSDKTNELILKIIFYFNRLVIFKKRGGGLFEIGRPRSMEWKNFEHR